MYLRRTPEDTRQFAETSAAKGLNAGFTTIRMDVYNGTYTERVGREQNYAEEFMRKNDETTEAQRIVFEKAVAAGVTILFGADLGVLPHDLGARQFV